RMATAHVTADPGAARTLGEAFRALDYSEGAISRLLGDEAYAGDPEDAPVAERRLPQTELGTVIRAFFLQLPVSRRAAGAPRGRRGLAALEATGLAEIGAEVVPRVRLMPHGDPNSDLHDYPA